MRAASPLLLAALASACSPASPSGNEEVAVVGGMPITRRDLDAAVARLGLPACDSLRLLVQSRLLHLACGGEASCLVSVTSGESIEPGALRRSREELVGQSEYIATRRRRNDAFLAGFARDRATRADIERRITSFKEKVEMRIATCEWE